MSFWFEFVDINYELILYSSGYDIVKSGRWLPSLRRNIFAPSSGQKYELGSHPPWRWRLYVGNHVQIYIYRNPEVPSRHLPGETEEEQKIISHDSRLPAKIRTEDLPSPGLEHYL
jgi:hypothetical protein